MSLNSYGKRTNNSLPAQIRCRVGNEMKSKDEFSQSQLKRLADLVARGQRIQPDKGIIACMAHSGAPRDELKCRGPCGKYKHISEFSKNQRKTGDRRWCIKCTEWSESTGHVYIPLPASNNLRSLEERDLARENGRYLEHAEGEARAAIDAHSRNTSSFVSGNKFKTGDPEALTLLESLTLSEHDASIDQRDTSSIASSRDSSPPPARAPHHLMPYMPFRRSDAEPTYQTESAPSLTSTAPHSLTDAAPRDTDRARLEYRAWGPDGKMVTRFKESTVASDTASTVTTSEVSAKKGGWQKVKTRKQPIEPPSYLAYEDPDVDVDYSDGSDDTM